MKLRKIILMILIIIWMATIFTFSSQISDKSGKTSGNTIRFVLDKLSITKDMNDEQIQELIEKLQPPVRKLAHFSIYTLGGILTMLYAEQYEIIGKKKIIYSLLFCAIYAITDEIHQYYVPRKKLRIERCTDRFNRCTSWNNDNLYLYKH